MKKERFSFIGWLSKALLLTALLFFSVGETFAAGNITNSTKNIAQENVKRVRNTAQSMLDEVKDLKNDIDEAIKGGKDIWGEGSDGVEQTFSEITDIFKDFKNVSLDKLKGMDTLGLGGGVDALIDDLKSKIKDESEVGQKIKTHLDNLKLSGKQLINDVKNVITLNYTMPVGIRSDNMKFELSVDTLMYNRDEANSTGSVALDAHAYWTLPFTAADEPVTLAFKGENVVIKGSGTSKISIDPPTEFVKAEYIRYTLSKNKVYLDLSKKSYLEIDCNGFKEIFLKGKVTFASQVITPKDVTPTDSLMSASFEVFISDLNDMLFEAQFDKPFKVKATQDIIYKTYGLVADFSTKRNGNNFQFPKGYKSPFAAEDSTYWTGFAIKELSVDLTQQFPEFPLETATANNMLIDETGVSGWFEATVTTGKKKQNNSTIKAEFREISIGLSGGKISGGGLSGDITICPLVDKNNDTLTLGLEGKMYTDALGKLNYDIKTELKRNMVYDLPIIKTATLTLGQGTSVQFQHYTDSTSGDSKNIFTFVMNGGLDVKNKLVNINGLKFEGLRLCSDAPHFKAGKFSLNGVDVPSLHGLPFGLKSMEATTNTKNEAMLQPKIYLGIIGKESNDDEKQGVSVEAGFDLISTISDDENKPGWKITGLRVNQISVDVSYSAFHLKGMIQSFRDDPVNGDGFNGDITFSMKTPKISASASAYFGKTKYDITTGGQLDQPFKYWYVSADCGMPPGIVLFPPAVYLKSVSLSAYSRVRADFDVKEYKVTKKTPDKTLKFGFTAGIGFYAAQDNLVDAKVRMGMDFSSSGGVSKIFLDGKVGILGESDQAFLLGTVQCYYDFENEIFNLDVTATPGGKIKDIVDGTAWLKFRSYPDGWYCNSGTVTNPIALTFMKKIKAKTYLMFGDSVPTMLPPLDPKISSLFNVTQSTATSSDHSAEFSNGTGFAFGVALSLDCHFSKFVYADLEFLGGTDVLVVRKSDGSFFCGQSKYRAKGQVYVYLEAGAGIKVRKKKFEIVEFKAAADLMGEVPKPVYIEGNIAFDYRVLGGLIKGHAHANYSHGTHCDVATGKLGEFKDGTNFEVIEDQKAQDENGHEINADDWE